MAIFSALGGMMGANAAQQGGQQGAQTAMMGGLLGAQASQRMFDQGVGYMTPFWQQGLYANSAVNGVLGLGPQQGVAPGFYAQPGAAGSAPPGGASPAAAFGSPGVSGQLGVDRLYATSNPFDPNTIGAGYSSSPGYAFRMNQGMAALDASAASRGMLLSGANIKAGQEYASGLANQDYWDYVNQKQQGLGLDYTQRSAAYDRIFGQQTLGANAGNSIFGGAVTSGGQQAGAISNAFGNAGQNLTSAGQTAGGIFANAGSNAGRNFMGLPMFGKKG